MDENKVKSINQDDDEEKSSSAESVQIDDSDWPHFQYYLNENLEAIISELKSIRHIKKYLRISISLRTDQISSLLFTDTKLSPEF